MISRHTTFRIAGLSLPILLFACKGEEPPPAPRTPQSISVVAGDNQQAQAGTRLPTEIQFVVRDGQGDLPGITVNFTVSDPTALLSASSAVSGPSGRVAVGWTVGGTVGQQTLTGSVAGISPATVGAIVSPGPPTRISPVSSPSQFTIVSREVAVAPAARVVDAFGNGLPGIAVNFSDATGRSTVEGSDAVTDATGVAGVAGWRISNEPGAHTLVAMADALPDPLTTNFIAFGIPAAVQAFDGDAQTANAGTLVATRPGVLALDDASQPLAGVQFTFSVTEGDGRVLGNGVSSTEDDGVARAEGWVLGLTPGANALEVTSPGSPPLGFSATGVAAQPAQSAATSPVMLAGLLGNFITPSPSLRVLDDQGKPVAGVTATFAVTEGTGELTRASQITDFDGRATLPAWRLDGTNASQAVSASVEGLPALPFTAAAAPVPPTAFTIEVRFTGPEPTTSQRAAFESAAARWSEAIIGDLVEIPMTPEDGTCGGQTLDETVDDVLIFATIEEIDGPGSILGSAGPCFIRDDNLLTVVGRMRFDVADVQNLQANETFEDVILHEMGHVLGIGSLWNLQGLMIDRGGADPIFIGLGATAAFAAADPTFSFGGRVVPVENSGGPGTRDGHWREQILNAELMTGFNDLVNPMSAITIASLRDQGYVVTDAVADAFTLPLAIRAVSGGPGTPLREPAWVEPIRTVDRRGVVRRVFMPSGGPLRR